MEAGGKRPVGARLGAQLWTRGRHSRGKQRVQRVGAGVGTQQHRPVILLIHQRSLAEIAQRRDQSDTCFLKILGSVEVAKGTPLVP